MSGPGDRETPRSLAPIDPTGPGTWPKSARLRRRSDFLAVQDRGRRWSGPHFTVWFRPNGSIGARIGLTVSRRVGGAVVRNRVKRWLREAFRRSRTALPAVDLVCIARASATEAGWEGLSSEVSRLVAFLSALPASPSVSR